MGWASFWATFSQTHLVTLNTVPASFRQNGDLYEGSFANDRIRGHGAFSYKDGRKYVGKVLNGRIHGNGTMTYPANDPEKRLIRFDVEFHFLTTPKGSPHRGYDIHT
jgi:hypothetical protein